MHSDELESKCSSEILEKEDIITIHKFTRAAWAAVDIERKDREFIGIRKLISEHKTQIEEFMNCK